MMNNTKFHSENQSKFAADYMGAVLDVLSSALGYAEQGMSVFPCCVDKKPLTSHGFKDASTDTAIIKGWWEKHPESSIGWAVPESMLVLDVDVPEGPKALKKLEAIHGKLPATRTQRTGGGGFQYFFGLPKGVTAKNSARKIGPGIDTRSFGGYVILPPSGHPIGGTYKWIDEREPALCPRWVLGALKPKNAPRNESYQQRSCDSSHPYIRKAVAGELQTLLSAGEGGRNNALNTAAAKLGSFVGGGCLSESEAYDMLLNAALAIGLPEHEARKTIKSGLSTGMRSPRGIPEQTHTTNRPINSSHSNRGQSSLKVIDYLPTQTGRVCQEASMALRDSDSLVYRYNGSLVKIVNRPPSSVRMVKKLADKGHKYPSMPVVSHLTPETLCHELEKIVELQTTLKDGEKKPISWPVRVLRGLIDMTEPHEQALIGIVEHPYVNTDFDPVLSSGFDSESGLFKCFDCHVEGPIGFAEPALSFLTDKVFADFPFASDRDQIAAVACLLTGMQRRIIYDGCPGFLLSAPVQSSGKTAFAQIISHLLYGRPVAASSFADNDAEMAKHLLGILQEGHPCILFDNIQEGSVIESNEIAKVITADIYSNRLLSKNKTVTVPSSVLWLFTGNNISVCGDFNTRILPIELDPQTANPDQRTFTRPDIGAWCEKNRKKALEACVEVITAGKGYTPAGLKPSRFPSWDSFVRFPLYKLSGIDVAEIFQKNKLGDPKIEGQTAFFEAWHETFGSTPQTVKAVLDKCQESSNYGSVLSDALLDIFSGGLPNTRSLGKWLGSMKNRFFGEYRLVDAGTGTTNHNRNKKLWAVNIVRS